ncbi:MAG TPA: peroxiredoxin family protein [Kofleriaceae bacterium]|nr:peroxiredoxin family protein [Kofleriaceae bacterium]
MRSLLVAVLLCACKPTPAPVETPPLPPDQEEAPSGAGPVTRKPATPDEPIAAPTDDRPHAKAGSVRGPDGAAVELAGLWAESNVVVVFYRGYWCKICRKHLAGLQETYKDLLHAGAHLYAISVDDPDAIKKMVGELGLEYPVLSDGGGALARSWGVYDESTGIAKPATFLIARGGAIAYQEVGHSPSEQKHGYALMQQVKQYLPADAAAPN